MSVERTTSMPTRPNVPSKSSSLHRPSSSQQVWNCMKSDGKFMNALTSFMNESWVTISEAREKSGLNPNYEISDEELSRKIEEISRRLQMKYKEVTILEYQKARLVKRSVGPWSPSDGDPYTPALEGPTSTPAQLPERLISEHFQPVAPSPSGQQPGRIISELLQPAAPSPSGQQPGRQFSEHFQPVVPSPSAQDPGRPISEHFQPVVPSPSAQYPESPFPEHFQPTAPSYPAQYPEGPPSEYYRQCTVTCPAVIARMPKKPLPRQFWRMRPPAPAQYPGSPEHFQPIASSTLAHQHGYSGNADISYSAGQYPGSAPPEYYRQCTVTCPAFTAQSPAKPLPRRFLRMGHAATAQYPVKPLPRQFWR